MKPLLILASLAISPDAISSDNHSTPPQPSTQKVAMTCFSKGEQVSGMNKICYYDCLGSTVAINVNSYELCPLTIDR